MSGYTWRGKTGAGGLHRPLHAMCYATSPVKMHQLKRAILLYKKKKSSEIQLSLQSPLFAPHTAHTHIKAMDLLANSRKAAPGFVILIGSHADGLVCIQVEDFIDRMNQ